MQAQTFNELDFNDHARPPPARKSPPALDHQKELVKLFNKLAYRHGVWRVFADFCEMAAITFSNAVDKAQYDKREERYLQIVKAYERAEVEVFPQILAEVVLALEEHFGDVLGRTFHDLELHNKWAGQFFSPDAICQMMAAMTVGDAADLRERIAARGFITAQEPAVGSGAMVIALARAMREAGINYQEHLHVTAIDVDPKCAHMAYVQFTLLHIPAIVIHGNALSLEEYGRWYTPAHFMGGWDWKLRRQEALEKAHQIIAAPPIGVPPISVEDAPEAGPDLTPVENNEQKLDSPKLQLTLF